MKEKIIDYIELLEAKARQNDEYYKERLELYVSNQEKDKQLEAYKNMRLEINSYICNNSQYDENIDDCWVRTNELIEIIDKVGGSDE